MSEDNEIISYSEQLPANRNTSVVPRVQVIENLPPPVRDITSESVIRDINSSRAIQSIPAQRLTAREEQVQEIPLSARQYEELEQERILEEEPRVSQSGASVPEAGRGGRMVFNEKTGEYEPASRFSRFRSTLSDIKNNPPFPEGTLSDVKGRVSRAVGPKLDYLGEKGAVVASGIQTARGVYNTDAFKPSQPKRRFGPPAGRLEREMRAGPSSNRIVNVLQKGKRIYQPLTPLQSASTGATQGFGQRMGNPLSGYASFKPKSAASTLRRGSPGARDLSYGMKPSSVASVSGLQSSAVVSRTIPSGRPGTRDLSLGFKRVSVPRSSGLRPGISAQSNKLSNPGTRDLSLGFKPKPRIVVTPALVPSAKSKPVQMKLTGTPLPQQRPVRRGRSLNLWKS